MQAEVGGMHVIDTGNIAEILAAAVAFISAGTAVYFSIKTARDSKLNQHLQVAGLKQQYFVGLQAWANEVVTAMSEAILYATLIRRKCLMLNSSTGDIFYIPNYLLSWTKADGSSLTYST